VLASWNKGSPTPVFNNAAQVLVLGGGEGGGDASALGACGWPAAAPHWGQPSMAAAAAACLGRLSKSPCTPPPPTPPPHTHTPPRRCGTTPSSGSRWRPTRAARPRASWPRQSTSRSAPSTSSRWVGAVCASFEGADCLGGRSASGGLETCQRATAAWGPLAVGPARAATPHPSLPAPTTPPPPKTQQTQFKAAGATQFGSGWAWLVADKSGKLTIEKTPNAVTPVVEGKTPILTMVRPPRGAGVWGRRGGGGGAEACLSQAQRAGPHAGLSSACPCPLLPSPLRPGTPTLHLPPGRVGARLLPGLPEPPPGLHDHLCGQGGGRVGAGAAAALLPHTLAPVASPASLRRGLSAHASPRPRPNPIPPSWSTGTRSRSASRLPPSRGRAMPPPPGAPRA
jgi:hypothetical protein